MATHHPQECLWRAMCHVFTMWLLRTPIFEYPPTPKGEFQETSKTSMSECGSDAQVLAVALVAITVSLPCTLLRWRCFNRCLDGWSKSAIESPGGGEIRLSEPQGDRILPSDAAQPLCPDQALGHNLAGAADSTIEEDTTLPLRSHAQPLKCLRHASAASRLLRVTSAEPQGLPFCGRLHTTASSSPACCKTASSIFSLQIAFGKPLMRTVTSSATSGNDGVASLHAELSPAIHLRTLSSARNAFRESKNSRTNAPSNSGSSYMLETP